LIRKGGGGKDAYYNLKWKKGKALKRSKLKEHVGLPARRVYYREREEGG